MAMPPEPPEEPPAPPPPALPAEGGDCPRCGAPYEPLQEYCLECGLRLPVARGLVAVLSTAWRRRLPWYPGDWIWPVLLGLIVAALAATIAILATRENEKSATRTRAETTQTVPVGSGTGAEPPAPTGTNVEPPPPATGTETTPTAEPPPTTSGGLTEWPAGQDGWTVVLASVPESAGRASAVREAKKAIRAGVTEVGVLDSSEYSSLHPGYFVVFSGVFTSRDEAQSGLDTARGNYPQAYVRQITQ